MTRFDIENYGWKDRIIRKVHCEYCWFSLRDCWTQTRLIPLDQNVLIPLHHSVFVLLVVICIIGILRHFGTENYAWKLGIIQNFSEYWQFFFHVFSAPNCADTPNSHINGRHCSLNLLPQHSFKGSFCQTRTAQSTQ